MTYRFAAVAALIATCLLTGSAAFRSSARPHQHAPARGQDEALVARLELMAVSSCAPNEGRLSEQMATKLKLNPADFYDVSPSTDCVAGDIWSGLAITTGPQTTNKGSGVVVTPACDLANGKSETLTFLPVVPLVDYLISPAMAATLVRATVGQLTAAGLTASLGQPHRYAFPDPTSATQLADDLQNRLNDSAVRLGKAEKAAGKRALAGLRLLARGARLQSSTETLADVTELLGLAETERLLDRLIRNAHSVDLHFVPADGEPKEWSGVSTPSLVLFRYPVSAPIQVFEMAMQVSVRDWPNAIDTLCKSIPSAHAFREVRPLKHSTLRPRFLADLLTRYVGMHVRLGAPSFTSETVKAISKSLLEG